jgi:hypothetical protein
VPTWQGSDPEFKPQYYQKTPPKLEINIKNYRKYSNTWRLNNTVNHQRNKIGIKKILEPNENENTTEPLRYSKSSGKKFIAMSN